MFELVDGSGNRYGRYPDEFEARIAARLRARDHGTAIFVYRLAVSDFADGRYGERCYFTAYPPLSDEAAAEQRGELPPQDQVW